MGYNDSDRNGKEVGSGDGVCSTPWGVDAVGETEDCSSDSKGCEEGETEAPGVKEATVVKWVVGERR